MFGRPHEADVDFARAEFAGLIDPEVRHQHDLGKRDSGSIQVADGCPREIVAISIPLPSLRSQPQMASTSQSLWLPTTGTVSFATSRQKTRLAIVVANDDSGNRKVQLEMGLGCQEEADYRQTTEVYTFFIFGALPQNHRYRVIKGREPFYEGRDWTEGVRFRPLPQVPTLLAASADRRLWLFNVRTSSLSLGDVGAD